MGEDLLMENKSTQPIETRAYPRRRVPVNRVAIAPATL
jgi:hypothetical protein